MAASLATQAISRTLLKTAPESPKLIFSSKNVLRHLEIPYSRPTFTHTLLKTVPEYLKLILSLTNVLRHLSILPQS